MPLSFAIVCEATADRDTACGLADRVISNDVEWISDEDLHYHRAWRGLEATASHLLWRDIPELAKQANIRAHGHFDGQPGAPDAHAARRALLLLKLSPHKPDAVALIRDDDRQTERRQGLEQARNATRLGVPILIGLAHLKRECWVLAGFDPCDSEEQERLKAVRKELGFDPATRAEELTAKHDHDLKSAKRVLALLIDSDRAREEDCWKKASLQTLEQRGKQTGLTDYLQEVRTLLVPLFR
jgi:hypothetical protein